MGKVEVMKNI